MKDMPKNVSGLLKPDWLIPFAVFEAENEWLQRWGNNGVETWIELETSASMDKVNEKLKGFIKSKDASVDNSVANIYPLSRMRLYSNFDDNGNEIEGRMKQVRLFTIIAWIILFIACINFMNLATAYASKRAKEVGVKKTLGAKKTKLVTQFIGEAIVLACLSSALAIGILYLVLPAYNELVEKQLVVNLFSKSHLLVLLGITLTCGILAGLYPAFYLSSFNPLQVLKGVKTKTGGATFVRKGLVVLQFSASIIFITCTIIIYQQIRFGKSRDIGYDQAHLIYTSLHNEAPKHHAAIRQQLLNTGVVENAATSDNNPLAIYNNTGGYNWEGKDPNKSILITNYGTSADYLATMALELGGGRNFKADLLSDSNHVLINETLAKLISNKDVIGTTITRGGAPYTIIGVIKDFVYNDVYQPVMPMVVYADPSANIMNIRLKANTDMASAIEKVGAVMKANNPGYPFEYKFIDESFDEYFRGEELVGKLASLFALLAIFISCIGLFGLAAYTAQRRTKEIGIRKVLGASVSGITTLLSKEFLVLVCISIFIAVPVAWYAMHTWLQDFPYRVAIHWWVFAFAGFAVLFIALITVSFQSVKAAIANPVKSLRTE
jgi:putative ABC transport system permease protein